MAFRRQFRRRGFTRRRRPGPETYTVQQCHNVVDVYEDMPCLSPLITGFALMVPNPTLAGSDPTTAAAVIGEKSKVVVGVKFEAVHWSDPNTWFGSAGCDPSPLQLAFMLRIREALVVLPLAAGSKTLPAYLPNFTDLAGSQSFDSADRVLWKRITTLPLWGINAGLGYQLTASMRDTNAGPQVVKAKVRLGEHQGLFYVRNFVHDVADLTPNVNCTIPVVLDFWAKVYFRTSFRGPG